MQTFDWDLWLLSTLRFSAIIFVSLGLYESGMGKKEKFETTLKYIKQLSIEIFSGLILTGFSFIITGMSDDLIYPYLFAIVPAYIICYIRGYDKNTKYKD